MHGAQSDTSSCWVIGFIVPENINDTTDLFDLLCHKSSVIICFNMTKELGSFEGERGPEKRHEPHKSP